MVVLKKVELITINKNKYNNIVNLDIYERTNQKMLIDNGINSRKEKVAL